MPKLNQNASTYEVMPGIFENHSYDKYLTIDIKQGDQVNDIFDAHRDIIACCGRKPNIYPQGNGRLMIEAASPDESAKLQALSSLGGKEAIVSPDLSLNQSKGIIYAPQLMPYSEEKLECEFLSQGVVKVNRMMRKIAGILTPQPTLILTFNSRKLPDRIEAAWFNYKIKEYIPRPRRCFHCQAFGHVMRSCRLKAQGLPARCINCGKDIHGECHDSPSCIHCGGNHSSLSKECEVFLFEKEVQCIRVKERVTFREAKLRTLSKFVRPGISFASIISNRNRRNRHFTQKINLSKDKDPVIHKADSKSSSQNVKRCRSNESVCEEPPSKTKISESLTDFSMRRSSVSSMEFTTVLAEVHADAEEELIASLPDLAPHSDGASPSLEVTSAMAGVSAAQKVAPVVADNLTSSEVAPAVAGASASLEAVQEGIDLSAPDVAPVWANAELSSREDSGRHEDKSLGADVLPDREDRLSIQEPIVADISVSLGTEISAVKPNKKSKVSSSLPTNKTDKGHPPKKDTVNSERKIIRLQHSHKEKATKVTKPVKSNFHKAGKGNK